MKMRMIMCLAVLMSWMGATEVRADEPATPKLWVDKNGNNIPDDQEAAVITPDANAPSEESVDAVQPVDETPEE